MKAAVLQFPGSNCDQDALAALRDGLGIEAGYRWHKETTLGDFDLVVVPGGFSYGDYLRCGAIARFSPIMKAVVAFAERGGKVLGICNGFQILCEAGLLPGALIVNDCLEYRCLTPHLRVEEAGPLFNPASLGPLLRLPIGHGEGNYRIAPEGLAELKANGQVLFRYADAAGRVTEAANPNGSIDNIAGIRNRAGNVFGMMPHPDRAFAAYHPSQDGLAVFRSLLELPAPAHA
ncbi:MAG: phosphoribosylformylglycinamidine synthase subunit PurQ [Puniceicoccaceae bacterium]|nr:MAG: phosphoribosylformylglycinamidine synthase subunit PurQ [Puniceicoccaceae bacterium]